MGGSSSLFKSVLLGQLAAADWRVGALVRLVKAWARQQGINSAGDGTLSSHALTLMVSVRARAAAAKQLVDYWPTTCKWGLLAYPKLYCSKDLT